MALATYADLQATVLGFINRASDADAIARCPDWITLAEDEMRMALNRLMVRQGETVNNAFAIASEYTTLPAGFYRMRVAPKLNLAYPAPLQYVAPSRMDNYASGIANTPRFYTVEGNQLRVNPAPDIGYTATIDFYGLTPLSAGVNWLYAAHPKLYLMATIAEAKFYYTDMDGYNAAQQDRDRMFSAIYTSDGSDQQAVGPLRIRTDTRNP